MLFTSSGILHYDNGSEDGKLKLIVKIDPDLFHYYRALCPKYLRLNQQRYAPHISVVRNELPPKMEHWNKYEGHLLDFNYDPYIQNGTVYYWLNIFCKRLEEIRLELGLEVSSPFTRPPDGFSKCFHCTIGNTKAI